MTYPIIFHIFSFDVVLFLTFIYSISFKKTKSKKVLLLLSSFGIFLIIELLYLLQSSSLFGSLSIPYIGVEIPQTLLLFIVVLFAMEVLRIEKK
jgi:hypothetical protein